LLKPPPHRVGRRPIASMTPGECRVLELVALGLSSREIGTRLRVSRQGVTYHIGNLFTKLGAESRAGLVARAYVFGLIAPSDWPPRVLGTSIPRGSNGGPSSDRTIRLGTVGDTKCADR
jgi:DNA-binding CsgD family transcriptional regulator